MNTVSTTRPALPDFDYEYHTISVDTIGQSSKNTFTVHLTQPLENIVQAKLIAARIDAPNSNVCHISVDELNTNYSQRTSNVYGGQSSMSNLNRGFGSVIQAGSNPIIFRDDYDVDSQYTTPIRKVDRLTCTLRGEDGTTINSTIDNFMIFKFVCKNKNLPFI